MKQILSIILLLFVGFFNPLGERQNITITGKVTGADDGLPLPGVNILIKGTTQGVSTDVEGKYSLKVPNAQSVLIFRYLGYMTQEVEVGQQKVINVQMQPDAVALAEIVVTAQGIAEEKKSLGYAVRGISVPTEQSIEYDMELDLFQGENYAEISENGFKSVWKNPLSTFSIDVDAASYSNTRRFLNNNSMPPKDAVKIEELINYFDYDYQVPKGDQPFAVNHEVSIAPWNPDHYLVHIGLQGEKIDMDKLPPSNIVFLLDVSGSMNSPNKLPLLKKSLKLLVNELGPEDRVAIVVYAGAAGEVLPSTAGDDKQAILKALDGLNAGGSTAGGAGIKLAYKIAQENFMENGNNRIILATDGDFNVGASSDKAMEDLIEEKRKSGVFLTVLGFGMGNYQDSKCEILADKGNGNHAYIDDILEAKKVLVNEFGGTLVTIAKDVKIQVEFNPGTVDGYRLIGYENRLLADEDFNDDTKDAGELGAGHTVTALYEVIPKGAKSEFKPVDDLKYQEKRDVKVINATDLMTVKLRYKAPDGDRSKYLDEVIKVSDVKRKLSSANFDWSAAVAAFGMKLRGSDYAKLSYDDILTLAKGAKGSDQNGYRAEFIRLVEKAQLIHETGD
jgi:Ca-activated chloride channel family protein